MNNGGNFRLQPLHQNNIRIYDCILYFPVDLTHAATRYRTCSACPNQPLALYRAASFPSNLTGQINGIGRVCQIKPDPLNANTWYACSASGGIWKSSNNGQSWKVLGTDALPLMNTSSICIDYTNPDIIYFSSGDPNYYTTDFGIWKTTNGGQTWVQSNTGISTRLALELLMDPMDHLTLLAATSSGIWKTTDGGQTWSEKLAGNNFCDMKWNPHPGSSVVYASSMNKFFAVQTGAIAGPKSHPVLVVYWHKVPAWQ
ncbi:MAG: hypothetical protein HWD58_03830 [Bacteroidota bacterium]|nr:MAG: hypothetical protein HWD58_03830 [Bacteroidota bacterium]